MLGVVNRGSAVLVAVILSSAGLGGCKPGESSVQGSQTTSSSQPPPLATWELIDRAHAVWGDYPRQVSALMEPCDQALEGFHSAGLARDSATGDAGRALSSSCDGVREAILSIPEPMAANPNARQALHMWAVTSALQAFERGNLGRVALRYAAAAEVSDQTEQDATIIQEALADDRTRGATADAFLGDAVASAGAQVPQAAR